MLRHDIMQLVSSFVVSPKMSFAATSSTVLSFITPRVGVFCCTKAARALSTSFVSSKLLLPELPTDSKRLYLLRHGETDWNKLGKMQGGGFDIHLNANGIEQASSAANELRHLPLELIASSHLERASKTADMVHALHPSAVRMTQIHEFGEFRFGKFEGLALHGEHQDVEMKKEFDEANESIYEDMNYAWPGDGGESTGQVNTRMRSALKDLFLKENHRHICIVGHGRSNRVLLASLLYGDPLQHKDIQQGNTCINVLDVDQDGNWMAQVINHVEHTTTQGSLT
jgi:broad specificity phosphatase PhoE